MRAAAQVEAAVQSDQACGSPTFVDDVGPIDDQFNKRLAFLPAVTYEPLTGSGQQQGGWLRRDVNGILRNIADTRFRKYKSTISCRDGETPCLDDAWIGITCEVSCAFEFSYPTGATPARPVVSGSTRTQGTVTYYRPCGGSGVPDCTASIEAAPSMCAVAGVMIDTTPAISTSVLPFIAAAPM